MSMPYDGERLPYWDWREIDEPGVLIDMVPCPYCPDKWSDDPGPLVYHLRAYHYVTRAEAEELIAPLFAA